ncbi:L-histidine N(alpha)-methyltransferase [Gracilimonas sediminicola]|uniref:L-histidine N(Alpha)-methyltransferase n=1 Tax=Gracilimonas sediminicola TaxID=2952158 RepID=A0A9X2RDW0_9BACT|nr:L-histidine N(alpha)-methyltransferase [Gracilimonas sediminicola]MCP9291490.1 L-histidine N(alpha)-methyltransferase [Gracilimonas sediminicola]
MTKVKERKSMRDEVLYGLTGPQKSLPSKYFYDERGSKIFDEITELEEYYPTRTERDILKQNVEEIGCHLGDEVILIEPGSGSSDKTRILLKGLNNIAGYIPIDISGEYLFSVASELQKAFPEITIEPLQADYTHSINLPDSLPEGRKVVFFPGSTIGNFKRDTVDRFLAVVADIVGREGAFLIGVDLKKEVEVLLAAYNDSKGVTAAFNRNILRHINRELGTDFDPDLFDHKAIWNEEESRIEMHLVCKEDHEVVVNGTCISFRKGECIHTENSHKYTLEEFGEIVSPWFEVKKVWTDEKDWFSLQYLEPK